MRADDLHFCGQLDGTVASRRHRHSEPDTWPTRELSKQGGEPGLPSSPFPSEVDDLTEDNVLDVSLEYLGKGEDTDRFSRRHTLSSLTDDAQRSCPALPARCPVQTYTAVTLSTPDAVFSKGEGDILSPARSTQSTIVCGEKNWETRVDWETTSMTSGSSSGIGAAFNSQRCLASDDLQRDVSRHKGPTRGPGSHARHYSVGSPVPGFEEPTVHRNSSTKLKNASPDVRPVPEARSTSEPPFLSAIALWTPGDSFSPIAHDKRRATADYSGHLSPDHPPDAPAPTLSGGFSRYLLKWDPKGKRFARDDSATTLRQQDTGRVIRARTAETARPDQARIHEAMTESTMVRRRTSLPCSEDHRPHICLHELSDDSD